MGHTHHPHITCLFSFYAKQAKMKCLVYSPDLKIFEYMKLPNIIFDEYLFSVSQLYMDGIFVIGT
jgi:hypothetical protein